MLRLPLRWDNHKGHGKHSYQYADDNIVGQRLAKDQRTDKDSRYGLEHTQYWCLRSTDVAGSYSECGCRYDGGENRQSHQVQAIDLGLDAYGEISTRGNHSAQEENRPHE